MNHDGVNGSNDVGLRVFEFAALGHHLHVVADLFSRPVGLGDSRSRFPLGSSAEIVN